MNDDHGGHMPPPIMPTPPGVTGTGATYPHVDDTQMTQPTVIRPHPQSAPDLSNTYAPNTYAPNTYAPNTYAPGSYAPGVVTPNQPPQKKNRGLLIGAGVAVVALLMVVVGIFALRGNSNVGASTFSLQAAANAASNAKSVAFDMTVKGGEQDIKITGQIDTPTQMLSMTMEFADLMGQGTMDMIVDTASKKMYMSSEIFGAMSPTEWISVDLSTMPGVEEDITGGLTGNPLEVTELFASAQKVKKVGKETINGVETMHYEVTVNTADVREQAPDALGAVDSAAIEDLPDEVVYQVYVTENNELARMSMEIDENGTPVLTVIDVKAIDNTEPITIPDESDVTDMTEMMGGAMGAFDSATG